MAKEPVNLNIDEVDMEEDIVTLLDENDNELKFFHNATVDYKGEWYIFLQPVEAMEDLEEDEVVIFKLGQDENGDDLFLPIEDEELLNAVYDEYVKQLDELEGECDCGHHHHDHEGACCEDGDCCCDADCDCHHHD